MVGRDVELERRQQAKLGSSLLSVTNLTVGGRGTSRQKKLDGISFDVRAGEVFGIFGSVGCGADELVKALFGIVPYSPANALRINGKRISIQKPSHAIQAGLGYLPGHRQRDAIFPRLSVGQNISVLALDRLTRNGIVLPSQEAQLINQFYSRFRIRAQSVDSAISTLSGGNQQKAILARVLSRDPDVLILHEPTQGVDIATKQDVYRVIDSLAQAGKAVLLASSDLEEVLIMSDRILVLKQGRSMGIWDRNAAKQHNVLAAATGGH
jgi:ABC-type sugar transport system ATPase subunit